jgi:hypothetical protein
LKIRIFHIPLICCFVNTFSLVSVSLFFPQRALLPRDCVERINPLQCYRYLVGIPLQTKPVLRRVPMYATETHHTARNSKRPQSSCARNAYGGQAVILWSRLRCSYKMVLGGDKTLELYVPRRRARTPRSLGPHLNDANRIVAYDRSSQIMSMRNICKERLQICPCFRDAMQGGESRGLWGNNTSGKAAR